MSLFPAYLADQGRSNQETENEDWLKNSSYKISTVNKEEGEHSDTSNSSSKTEDKDLQSSSKDYDKKKHKTKRSHEPKSTQVYKVVKCTDDFIKNLEGDYGIDKTPQRIYLSIDTISRPAVPKYRNSSYKLYDKIKKRRYKTKRYYKISSKSKEDEEINKEIINKEQESIRQKTMYFNGELGKDPENIDMWLEYINFQDIVWVFERSHSKGSIAKGLRATAEKKLSIFEKALSNNPTSEKLIRERLKVCQSIYPNDELIAQLKKLVDKTPDNINLWQGYIEATQCSMAHCNATSVITIYKECIKKIIQLRHSQYKSRTDEKILCIFHQCSLFLRQAGLWEQLWTLLRSNLSLNLTENDQNKFNIVPSIKESQLLELEEVILESKLPSHELWLRVEKLRESSHWVPWNVEQCEDPQRTVFVEDISDLIHPLSSQKTYFYLIIMVFNLLKIPILPFRHSALQKLGLDCIPWSIDSIENLLSIFYPHLLINLSTSFLEGIDQFAVGPQYLKTHPGQEEYLDFIINVMKKCGECFENDDRTAIFIWCLRFQKLLIVLDRDKKFKMPTGKLKKIKSGIKEFLKQPENRNNVLYYQEYALIEYELGNIESSYNILLTAISMFNDNSVNTFDDEKQRNSCSLYRTLIEIHIRSPNYLSDKTKLINYLISFILKTTVTDFNLTTINEAINKFKEYIDEIICSQILSEELSRFFLPDLLTDCIICHALLIFLSKSPFEVGILIERFCIGDEALRDAWQKEILWEWYVSLMYKTCMDNFGLGLFKLFRNTLNTALTEFPNNMYILTVASAEQTMSGCLTQNWWQLSKILTSSGQAIPSLFEIFILNDLLSKRIEQWNMKDNTDPVLAVSAIKNRILSAFNKLTTSSMNTKKCGLIWRFYLQFLYNNNYNPNMLRKVYYAAVEEVPWLKALYMDAAIYIPAELSQIQDLIIEKELRIHVTPEELEILKA